MYKKNNESAPHEQKVCCSFKDSCVGVQFKNFCTLKVTKQVEAKPVKNCINDSSRINYDLQEQ